MASNKEKSCKKGHSHVYFNWQRLKRLSIFKPLCFGVQPMNDNKKKGMYNNLIYITQIGISMITSIFLGFFIGKFIDNRLGTNWIFSLIFLALGIIAGFLNLFKMVTMDRKKRK